MPVQATCSECNKRIQAPDKFVGRSVKCPNCQTRVTFAELSAAGKRPPPSTRPLPSRLITCVECGAEHRLLRATAQQVRCRDCRSLFSVSEGVLYPFGSAPLPSPTENSSLTATGATTEATMAPANAAPAAEPTPATGPAPAPELPDSAIITSPAPSSPPPPAGLVPIATGPAAAPQPAPTAGLPGVTPLTPASIVAPVESAPVSQVQVTAPVEVKTEANNFVPVVTDPSAVTVNPGSSGSSGSPGPVPIQVAGPPTGGAPVEINSGGSGTNPIIATGADNAGSAGSAGSAYQPVLRQLGPKKSMVGRAIEKDLKNRGSRLKASVRCKIGPDKSFRQRIHQLGMFPEKVSMQVDDMMVLTIGDRAGDFRVILPFDKGVACPVEFVSVMPGHLPTSVGLLRGRGGNWGLAVSNSKPGSLLPQQVQSLMSAVGGQADGVWAVLDPGEPQAAAETLQQNRSLQADLRFDSKVKLGPMEVTYNVSWIAQAMPLGPDQYVLVAKFIPRNRMMSMNFGAEWFATWRDDFHRTVPQLPPGQGNFQCFDYGFIWGAVAHEMMGIQLF